MSVRQEFGVSSRESRVAVFSLLTGALIWGVIWYPYRVLRDAGVLASAAAKRARGKPRGERA